MSDDTQQAIDGSQRKLAHVRDPKRISRRRILKAATVLPAAAANNKQQATFVLVHGAWHGGWCYASVAEILRTHGHRVFTPTLTGLGERSHLAKLGIVDCSMHVKDIINIITWERLNSVILCGHSYGGMVIGAVADAIHDRIAAIVYLDACIPQDGKSMLDYAEPQQAVEFLRRASEQGGYMVPPWSAEVFNVNRSDRAMVDALCTPQPLATYIERLKLTGAHLNIPRKIFVLATNWKWPLIHEYARIKDDSSWTTLEIACGHDIMLDEPDLLADILLNCTIPSAPTGLLADR